MDYFKVQQNCLQEKLNIYYFDYTKYFCDNWKRVKMKKMQRKISSLTVSSRAVVEAKKKKKVSFSLFFNTELAKSFQVTDLDSAS